MSALIGRLLRAVWRSFTTAGLAFSPFVPADLLRATLLPPAVEDTPEGEWPERLVPDVEPTPDERLLWAQLEELDR